jgi:LmbE family N-acetylglucosaminyl deacetylase
VVVALGAHCDDIEIGAGGLLLSLAAAFPGLTVLATVLSSTPVRAAETRAALPEFLPGVEVDIEVHDLPDGRLPTHWGTVKSMLTDRRADAAERGGADIVLAPAPYDAHQDHRIVAEIVPTVFRDQLVLFYEILKWDGDFGRPNIYQPLDEKSARRKVELLGKHYVSQQCKPWYDEETFLALMRLRGIECHARYAEAFSCTKAVMDLPLPVEGIPPS